MRGPIYELATNVRSKLRNLPSLSSRCCIYKVPGNLRSINREAYGPWLVSIGPFHCKDERLRAMEEHKLRYLASFLERAKNRTLEDFIKAIKEQEADVRGSYSETISLNSEAFLEILLVDTAFIIELFLRSYSGQTGDETDRIFAKPRMIVEVTRDLKIEENQLPFFILRSVYDLAFQPNGQEWPYLINIACEFFKVSPRNTASEPKHFVDLLRTCHLPSLPRPRSSDDRKVEFCPSVTDLHEAGVRFVAAKSSSILDIKFSKGVLEIPPIELEDVTESFWRNLVVFEQCHYYSDSYIIDYVALLDFLINTPKDVEILIQNGIIKNWLGNNEEASNLFSNLFKQIRLSVPNFYYSTLCQQLKEYYNSPWHRHKALLKHKYFNHPWAIISFAYAMVLLFLTIVQCTTGVISNIQASN